jgi:protein required for attachment to host cells
MTKGQPMRDARIWVVIAHDETASICSSFDGTSVVVSASSSAELPADAADLDRTGRQHRAWYGPEQRNCFFNRGPRQQFAGHIAQILREAAREDAYDGLILIAAPGIEAELRRALSPETRAKLLGEVIRDGATSQTIDPLSSERVCH